MAVLLWDQTGERRFETGTDRGVLFPINTTTGAYEDGVAWNGLTAVTESPSGAEPTALYADNIKYVSLTSAEEFGGSIEAFTYPDAFAACDGNYAPSAGVSIGQQARQGFGLAYRTLVGNDVADQNFGYKIHLVYGAKAAPSGKNYTTVSDSPEAVTLSWEFTTTPVAMPGKKPTACITIDSTKVSAANLLTLENAIYGTAGSSPRLPLPAEIITMFSTSQTEVIATAPTFVSATGVITIPVVTGVTYRRADTNAVVTGTTTIAGAAGASLVITAAPSTGAYKFAANSDDDWAFVRTA